MGVCVGGVFRLLSAYFRRGSVARQNDARHSHSRYPILREAGWLDTVVGLVHIGVVGTGDLAGGL